MTEYRNDEQSAQEQVSHLESNHILSIDFTDVMFSQHAVTGSGAIFDQRGDFTRLVDKAHVSRAVFVHGDGALKWSGETHTHTHRVKFCLEMFSVDLQKMDPPKKKKKKKNWDVCFIASPNRERSDRCLLQVSYRLLLCTLHNQKLKKELSLLFILLQLLVLRNL